MSSNGYLAILGGKRGSCIEGRFTMTSGANLEVQLIKTFHTLKRMNFLRWQLSYCCRTLHSVQRSALAFPCSLHTLGFLIPVCNCGYSWQSYTRAHGAISHHLTLLCQLSSASFFLLRTKLILKLSASGLSKAGHVLIFYYKCNGLNPGASATELGRTGPAHQWWTGRDLGNKSSHLQQCWTVGEDAGRRKPWSLNLLNIWLFGEA